MVTPEEVVLIVAGGVGVLVVTIALDLWRARPQGTEAWREFVSRRFRLARRPPRLDWARLAQDLGLEHPDPERVGVRLATGTMDGLGVSISEEWGSDTSAPVAVVLEVNGRGRIPEELILRAEDRLEALKKAVSGEDLQVGDEAFDARVNVHGPEDVALAALGQASRQAAARLVVGRKAVFKNGVVRVELGAAASHEEIVALVRAAVADVCCFEAGLVAPALAAHAASDPEPAVRRRNLEVLLKVWGRHEAARHSLDVALEDPDPSVRLVAAMRTDRARAVPVLGSIIEDATAPLAARGLAIDEVTRLRAGELFDTLCAVAGTNPQLARAAARALAEIGDPRAESTLLSLLQLDSREARLAAIVALGLLGTVEAVPALGKESRVPELAEAARDSIRRIQSRLSGAQAGGLSVAAVDHHEGALSVPGAVSPVVSPGEEASEPSGDLAGAERVKG